VGDHNYSCVQLENFSDIHLVTETYGKLLNICDESDESLLDPAIENALKKYTGGTPFNFKKLYHESFSAYPTAKIMISTNHLPKFKDTSEGVWRRILLAPFNYIVPEEKIIKGLSSQIIKNEMPGVLKWALEGARSLIKDGKFVIPDVSKAALQAYKKEAHPEYSFLEDNFEETQLPEFSVSCKQLRTCYETWCKGNGYGVKNDKNLGQAVKKMFPHCERQKGRKGGTIQWIYVGLSMKSDTEFANKEGLYA